MNCEPNGEAYAGIAYVESARRNIRVFPLYGLWDIP